MTFQELISEIEQQPVWEQNGDRAPHKRLTILYAIGQALRGNRLTRYADAEPALIELLDRFGPPRKTHHPEQPVWRLARRRGERTRFWEVTNVDRISADSSNNPKLGELREHASFGLSDDAAALFRRNPAAVQTAAYYIADSLLPETLQEELVRCVLGNSGFGAAEVEPETTSTDLALITRESVLVSRSRRDPRFSHNVRHAYGHACAVCSIAPRMSDASFGLEGAHIRWANARGPDEIPNGICLCRMHHVAFDCGAFKIDENRRVQLSSRLERTVEAEAVFGRFDGNKLRMPAKAVDAPNEQMLHWHRHQVFRP